MKQLQISFHAAEAQEMADYSKDPHQNPYWQDINRQNNPSGGQNGTQGWENRQDTRNSDPNWHPEDNLGLQLSRTAQTFGLFALFSGFILPIVVPGILAGIAIVLAIISKGRHSSFPRKARNAVIMGVITLVINIAIIGVSCFQILQALNNEDTMNELNEMMENYYGYSFDDLLESYGVELEGEGYA